MECKKWVLHLCVLLVFQISVLQGMANMASPIRPGTSDGAALSSNSIDILREDIRIDIAANNRFAVFTIDYYIKTYTNGKQIPLLFYAQDFASDFLVWVNGKPVSISQIPNDISNIAQSKWSGFLHAFDTAHQEGPANITIAWDSTETQQLPINDLKYFEVDLPKGEHHIRISYSANAWVDLSGWVRTFSFRYSLSPAKHWKSFGTLALTIATTNLQNSAELNIGNQKIVLTDTVTNFTYQSLPGDFMQFTYQPKTNGLAMALISIEPFGLAIIFFLIISITHYFLIWNRRRKNKLAKSTWLLIIGSILVPFIALVGYIFFFNIIDNIIGENASRYHGYTILVFLFYPVLVPIYWFISWLFDFILKRHLKSA